GHGACPIPACASPRVARRLHPSPPCASPPRSGEPGSPTITMGCVVDCERSMNVDGSTSTHSAHVAVKQQLPRAFEPASLSRRAEVNQLSDPMVHPENAQLAISRNADDSVSFVKSAHCVMLAQEPGVHHVRHVHHRTAPNEPTRINHGDQPVIIDDHVVDSKITVKEKGLVWQQLTQAHELVDNGQVADLVDVVVQKATDLESIAV